MPETANNGILSRRIGDLTFEEVATAVRAS
jgi:hypothetical protein